MRLRSSRKRSWNWNNRSGSCAQHAAATG